MSENFAAAVSELKQKIRGVVNDEVKAFSERTGLSPSAIRVEMFDVTAHGDKLRKYATGDVRISFNDY